MASLDRQTKLRVLGQSSEHEQDGVPATRNKPPTSRFGVYYAKSPRGQVPLVRTMMTSSCAKHCGYCPFGLDVDRERATWKTEELTKTVIELRDAGIAEGLFLTSGLAGNAVRMMDRMLDAVRVLRTKHDYRGYVHLKILPGTEDAQLEEALGLADRVSVNLEAPTDLALAKIAPEKSLRNDLAQRLARASRLIREARGARAGLVTQFVVGPGGESDRTLLQAADRLYRQHQVKRTYFSAFTPILGTPMEHVPPESPTREVRLYQADWLLRFYGFRVDEIPLDPATNDLHRDRDPKTAWALAQPSLFPLEINRAPRELLLRVPGLGPTSVERILRARRLGTIASPGDLEKLGVRTRRALGFLLLDGHHWPGIQSAMFGVEQTQLELFRYPRGFGRLPEDRRRIEPKSGGTYL
ncbi:radical SAM protein [Myxococcota bacterium]|nr:radical SAM protein [Myxococcota bacterium]